MYTHYTKVFDITWVL